MMLCVGWLSPLLPTGFLLKWGNFSLSCGRITLWDLWAALLPCPKSSSLSAGCWGGPWGQLGCHPYNCSRLRRPTLSAGHGSFPQSSVPKPAHPLHPRGCPSLTSGLSRVGSSAVVAWWQGRCPGVPSGQGAQPAATAAPSLCLPLPVPPPGQPSGPQPCPHPPVLPLCRLCPPLGAAPHTLSPSLHPSEGPVPMTWMGVPGCLPRPTHRMQLCALQVIRHVATSTIH